MTPRVDCRRKFKRCDIKALPTDTMCVGNLGRANNTNMKVAEPAKEMYGENPIALPYLVNLILIAERTREWSTERKVGGAVTSDPVMGTSGTDRLTEAGLPCGPRHTVPQGTFIGSWSNAVRHVLPRVV
jgi:hypothetical protein